MSILDLHLDKVKPLVQVPEGEHEFRILEAEVRDSQATPGNQYINLTLECLDVADALRVYERLHLPNGKDEDKDASKLRRINSFMTAFSVPSKKGALDLDDLMGKTGSAIVRLEEDEQSGDMQTRIRRFVKQQ